VGVACSLLLPIVLAVICGLGVLLGSLGDEAGRVVCGRAALAVGVVWLTAILATVVVSGIVVLDAEPRGLPRRRRPRQDRGQDGRESVHAD
jgi:hypothetical protein